MTTLFATPRDHSAKRNGDPVVVEKEKTEGSEQTEAGEAKHAIYTDKENHTKPRVEAKLLPRPNAVWKLRFQMRQTGRDVFNILGPRE